MTFLGYLASAFGIVLATLLFCVVVFDVWQVHAGRPTISRWTLDTSRRYPIVAALWGAVLGLLVGTLLGHLAFPQYITGGP